MPGFSPAFLFMRLKVEIMVKGIQEIFIRLVRWGQAIQL
jgi:hypothetical protein